MPKNKNNNLDSIELELTNGGPKRSVRTDSAITPSMSMQQLSALIKAGKSRSEQRSKKEV